MSKRSRRSGLVPSFPLFTSSQETALKVLSIMKEAFGAPPKAFWGLSKSADLLAPRGFVVSCRRTFNVYNHRVNSSDTYPIVSVKIKWWDPDVPLVILPDIKTVSIESCDFNSDIKLCEGVEELTFDWNSKFDKPIDLRVSAELRIVRFGCGYNQPLDVPPWLKELSFDFNGDFNHPLALPEKSSINILELSACFNHPIELVEGLERVFFGMHFTQPVTLPTTLKELSFDGISDFNHTLDLPSGLKYASLGPCMEHPVTLPAGLEELLWRSGASVDLPEGLQRASFWDYSHQPLTLPSSLKSITFYGSHENRYNLPLVLPHGCERKDDYY